METIWLYVSDHALSVLSLSSSSHNSPLTVLSSVPCLQTHIDMLTPRFLIQKLSLARVRSRKGPRVSETVEIPGGGSLCRMKAADTTDGNGIRAAVPVKAVADGLPSCARDFLYILREKEGGSARESSSSCLSLSAAAAMAAAGTDKQQVWPNSRADEEDKKGNPEARNSQILTNLMQTGGIKNRATPIVRGVAAGPMETRARCSCADTASGERSSHGGLHRSCDCNLENCAWAPSEEGLPPSNTAAPLKHQPWRSCKDQSDMNITLQKALAAMKKVQSEPEKKTLPDLASGRSITNPDARTLSMRERGRWGSSKMQQNRLFTPTPLHPESYAASTMAGSLASSPAGINVSKYHQHALQHVQCLHCGSFSTTPVSGVTRSGLRTQSFGRKVRDYSWRQEVQEQRRQERHHVGDPAAARRAVSPECARARAEVEAEMPPHPCEYARFPDMQPEYDLGPGSMKVHGANVMSWQERYMLLCRAIAAGAFLDGNADDMSGPFPFALRGYSSAVCGCEACEMCGAAEAAPSLRRGTPVYCSTKSGERMMELEALSGPIGYVSDSKAELNARMGRKTKRRWWTKLPSFGRSKGDEDAGGSAGGFSSACAREMSAQSSRQCSSSCGQRTWGVEPANFGSRECQECNVKTGNDGCDSGPIPMTPRARRPTPPRAAKYRPTPPPPPPFRHHKHVPRRWRLMKLCRYLMGFPLQT
ncbi:hypothetical protein KP509_27G069400 [Ceratopteris richardii]|uniref:Uncharacterized protein n=1 Tax=Ceratopteris richardii TaxID=49495 RepID=A0A8T2RIV6_CERRI|nr:hypothetical protein KP509_27G069400 [Ceratopteris richardii]